MRNADAASCIGSSIAASVNASFAHRPLTLKQGSKGLEL
jgi:hypothetical protein